MRLRASVERQIVLAGLACIVLSVWHPILCGNPVLWGWWKWDCGEWLHHCIRSCCWLLVTLKKEKRRQQLYTTEDGSKHQPEKWYTHTCSREQPIHHHHNIAHSSITFSSKKSVPRSSEPWYCFLKLFGATFSLPGAIWRTNYGACKLHIPVISQEALHTVRHYFGRGKRHWKIAMQKETQTEEQGSSICLEVPYLGPSPPAWPSWLCSRASTSCGSEHALLCCVTVTERSTHFKTDLCSSPLLCSGSTGALVPVARISHLLCAACAEDTEELWDPSWEHKPGAHPLSPQSWESLPSQKALIPHSSLSLGFPTETSTLGQWAS